MSHSGHPIAGAFWATIAVLVLLGAIVLGGCTAQAPAACTPPQQLQAGVCVDTQGGDGGNPTGAGNDEPPAEAPKAAKPSVKRQGGGGGHVVR